MGEGWPTPGKHLPDSTPLLIADPEYRARVAAVLDPIGADVNFMDVIHRARGMFPAEVKRWLLTAGRRVPSSPEAGIHDMPTYVPELHALESEWYFTQRSSDLLAELSRTAAPSLLLGVPTVAARLSGADAVLVDRCPWLFKRFPHLVVPTQLVDVAHVRLSSCYGTVLLDPPWYIKELYDWLLLAGRAVMPGGRVIFPLFGELTRPEAYRERQQILHLAESAGSVDIVADVIDYDVPLFEQRALAADGIRLSGPWRRADLVSIRVMRPFAPSSFASEDSGGVEKWSSYVIGTQVVKVRGSVSPTGEALLGEVPGLSGGFYNSVSRRDVRRHRIDFWTSRNRVARVLNPEGLHNMLRRLEGNNEDLRQRASRLLESEGERVRQLLTSLEVEL